MSIVLRTCFQLFWSSQHNLHRFHILIIIAISEIIVLLCLIERSSHYSSKQYDAPVQDTQAEIDTSTLDLFNQIAESNSDHGRLTKQRSQVIPLTNYDCLAPRDKQWQDIAALCEDLEKKINTPLHVSRAVKKWHKSRNSSSMSLLEKESLGAQTVTSRANSFLHDTEVSKENTNSPAAFPYQCREIHGNDTSNNAPVPVRRQDTPSPTPDSPGYEVLPLPVAFSHSSSQSNVNNASDIASKESTVPIQTFYEKKTHKYLSMLWPSELAMFVGDSTRNTVAKVLESAVPGSFLVWIGASCHILSVTGHLNQIKHLQIYSDNDILFHLAETDYRSDSIPSLIRSCLEDPEEFSKIVWGDSEIPFVPIDKTSYLWTKPSLTESGTIS
eukprot:gene2852-5689_t